MDYDNIYIGLLILAGATVLLAWAIAWFVLPFLVWQIATDTRMTRKSIERIETRLLYRRRPKPNMFRVVATHAATCRRKTFSVEASDINKARELVIAKGYHIHKLDPGGA